MKKTLIVLLALIMCLSLTACNDTEKEEQSADEPVGMANPVVEYGSLEEINEKTGVNLIKPSTVEVTNERFSVINDTVAEYVCEVNGREWVFRAAYVTDEDISGIHNEYNEFVPNQDSSVYVNDFYLERFFDGDRQYTIAAMNPISEDGEILVDQVEFIDCCMELESIQKQHMDDPVVGDYQDTVNENTVVYVERFGDKYNVSVNLTASESEFKSWTMYDAVKDGDKLTYRGEEIGQYTYDSEGNVISSNVTAANNVGWFEIKDGLLYWTGAAEEECRAWVFEKIIYE